MRPALQEGITRMQRASARMHACIPVWACASACARGVRGCTFAFLQMHRPSHTHKHTHRACMHTRTLSHWDIGIDTPRPGVKPCRSGQQRSATEVWVPVPLGPPPRDPRSITSPRIRARHWVGVLPLLSFAANARQWLQRRPRRGGKSQSRRRSRPRTVAKTHEPAAASASRHRGPPERR